MVFRKCDEMISFWPNRACAVLAWSWVVSRKWSMYRSLQGSTSTIRYFFLLHCSIVWLAILWLHSSSLHAYCTGSQWCTGILNGIACKSSQWLNSSLKFHLHFHCESDLTFPAGTITSSFLKKLYSAGYISNHTAQPTPKMQNYRPLPHLQSENKVYYLPMLASIH